MPDVLLKLLVAAALGLPCLWQLLRCRASPRAALAWAAALALAIALGLGADVQALARLRVDAVLTSAACAG